MKVERSYRILVEIDDESETAGVLAGISEPSRTRMLADIGRSRVTEALATYNASKKGSRVTLSVQGMPD